MRKLCLSTNFHIRKLGEITVIYTVQVTSWNLVKVLETACKLLLLVELAKLAHISIFMDEIK